MAILFFQYCLFVIVFGFQTTPRSYATPLSFNYSSFDSNVPEIFRERDAVASQQGIDLTANLSDQKKDGSVGRATYSKPLHLWDKSSGNSTNFTTHFSFIINSTNQYEFGDGLAFFLAPNGSRIQPDVKPGGGLALSITDDAEHALNSDENKFVAVEFDTFLNFWDPSVMHVGINIRSMRSNSTVPWPSNVMNGSRTEAWIAYDSRRKILNVSFVYFNRWNNSRTRGSLSAVVDLARYLPEWVTFGFSASTGYLYEVNRITSWDFDSSSDIVDSERIVNSEPEANSVFQKKNYKISSAFVIGLSVGACCLIAGAGFIWYGLRRYRRKEVEMNDDDHILDVSFGDDFKSNGTGPRKFSYNELVDATKNFSEGEKLGEGGFGAVYKGFLKDQNSYIAVKRVSRESKQGIKEYAAEVKIISRIRHRNLVKLVGWCHEKELLLVYEFMPNCSLDFHIFKGENFLTWKIRFRIAQGLASALLYLHEEGDQCVLHRDIKSSNVMLDSSFEAKLGDFGLARLVDHAKGTQTTVLAGTMGYMAPECFTSGFASKESDIYSFGVVALEIACGRRVFEPKLHQNQARLVEWVWNLYGIGRFLEAADSKLSGGYDESEMARLMSVGLWCLHPDRTFRPCIRQVINVLLNPEAPLPNIPLEMPIPAYVAPIRLSISSISPSYNCASGNGSEIKKLNYDIIIDDNSSKITSSSRESSHSASLLLISG
ncbi:L-type lectin-domain containing receptor kinase IX.1-like [Mercurialis annua]|uniref:L-type lectin-domain containing receptor kinase IX.1-like n=1 Tax=Mercurialis annua TaxID=3986 RepID=UPI00216035E9|nr:L-type lectin-domain containing receptor kinase IX.1-like [Mercurialis annua]